MVTALVLETGCLQFNKLDVFICLSQDIFLVGL